MSEEKKDRQIILQAYAMFFVSILANFYPVGIVGLIGFFLFIGFMIYVYYYRKKSEDNSLVQNHMIYLIRTLWVGSVYLIIFIVAAALYMAPELDLKVYHWLASGSYTPTSPQEVDVIIKNFVSDNTPLLYYGALIAFGVPLVFFFWRMINGVFRASKGYRIANVRSWF